ncbi:MAG: MBL fold metallo-hydrolase [Bacteroidetes bacterium]|nr:MBL fold metallo-hydrolase [Bacteroidota bacterium]
MKTPTYLFLILSLFFYNEATAQPDTLAVEKVAGNIWMLRQNSAGNVGVFASNDGFIIVDDQFRTDSEKIRDGLAKIAKLPVKYIINTHWHADHSEGNENFAKTGSVIVAQDNSRQRLTTDQFIELFQMLHAARPWEGLPSVTFTEDITFHERGETIHVFHVPNAHTDGDAIVHFQTSNVIHTGDVFVRYGLPFIDDHHGGSINGTIAATERLLSLANAETKIIPGHGAVSTKQDLMDYLEMLKVVREKVAKGIEQGKTIEQILAEKPAGSFTTFFLVDEFVRMVWRGMQKTRE